MPAPTRPGNEGAQSQRNDFPNGRFFSTDRQPRICRRNSFVGLPDCSGVQEPGAAEHLIARNVRVTVNQKVRPTGRTGRNVDQVERFSSPLQQQADRKIQTIIVVPQNGLDGRSDFAHSRERRKVAKIAQVPDFIGGSQIAQYLHRKRPVGVGDDCNAHGGSQPRRWRREKQPGISGAANAGEQDFHPREWTTAIDRRRIRLHTFRALKTPTILIAAFLAGAFFAEAQTPTPEISRDSKLAIQAALADFDTKNYDAALNKLQVLDTKMPGDPFIQNLLGAAYTKKKDFATAKTYFDKALEKEPDFFPAKFNVGELFFLQRQYAEALAYFQKMLEKDPRNELLQFKVFLCQLQLGNKDEAAKALKGIKYPGDTPAWYYGQAAWESKNGNNKKALEYVTGAQYIFGLKTALFDETFEDLGIKLR